MTPKTIVVKVGTSTLTGETEKLSRKGMLEIARQLSQLHDEGHRVVLVTSGASAAGREVLPGAKRDRSSLSKQMFCSVGQVHLMEVWTGLFNLFDIRIGQILLTRSDFANRTPYLNVRDTLEALLHNKIIPVVNENDAVTTKESVVGDNDYLGAQVANMLAADLYVIITDQKGLYDKDPRLNPDAELIPLVKEFDDQIVEAAKTTSTKLGTGGMATKIIAAQLASRSGTPTVLSNMEKKDLLLHLLQGEMVGTRFLPTSERGESRKRWLLSEEIQGKVAVDEGAAKRLSQHGASLLPVGITKVEGTFGRGAPIQIITNSTVIGVGLSNYSSTDIGKITRKRSDEIEAILGYSLGEEVIHRDNMVIL